MLSLTVFWINALVRSYSFHRNLATVFFFFFFLYLVSMSIIVFSFIYSYLYIYLFKVFKVLYPVLVDGSKSPIKYANLCTEEKQSKKEIIYSIFISLCIYLYIFIFKLLLCLLLNQSVSLFFPTCKLAALIQSKWRFPILHMIALPFLTSWKHG